MIGEWYGEKMKIPMPSTRDPKNAFRIAWGSREDIEETWLSNSGLKDEIRIHCDELGFSPYQMDLDCAHPTITV